MYCHELKASKGGNEYTIQCEDTPVSAGLVGIWPYDLQLDASTYPSLIQALHEWAREEGLIYRIYVSRDSFETERTAARSPVEN